MTFRLRVGDVNALPGPDCPRDISGLVIPCTDGEVTITDGIWILEHVILGTRTIYCEELADVNNDLAVDITGGVVLLEHLIIGGPPPSSVPDPSWNAEMRCREQGEFDDFSLNRGNLGCSQPTPCSFYSTF